MKRRTAYLLVFGLVIAVVGVGPYVFRAQGDSFVEVMRGVSVLGVNRGSDAHVNVVTPPSPVDAGPPARPSVVVERVLAGDPLDDLVDYDEVARRMFGAPCPTRRPGCTDHWKTLSDEDQEKLTGLVRSLVRKQIHPDPAFVIKDTRVLESDLSLVRTRAPAPSGPPLATDYVMRRIGQEFYLVGIVTEGSDLVTNYYDQIDKIMRNPDRGLPYLVMRMEAKIKPR